MGRRPQFHLRLTLLRISSRMEQTDRQLCKELWSKVYGLHPATFAAWCDNPEPRHPTCRQLQDGSAWVVEAFHGLELGRYGRED